ncbi:hypothetical protein ACLM5H_23065 [Fredinandcohnia humi]
MKLLAVQPYIVVSRKIEWNEQKYIESTHLLRMFEDRILSTSNEFQLEHVYDISSRSSFLYLHTNQGLFSYQVKEDPTHFIEAFKCLKL